MCANVTFDHYFLTVLANTVEVNNDENVNDSLSKLDNPLTKPILCEKSSESQGKINDRFYLILPDDGF